jgi:hypothetical protein
MFITPVVAPIYELGEMMEMDNTLWLNIKLVND